MVGTFDPNCALGDRDQLGQALRRSRGGGCEAQWSGKRSAARYAPKRKARRGGRAPMRADVKPESDAGHHVFESEEMDQRPQLTPLVVVEAHHQRVAGGLEALDIDLAHVDG